MRNTFYSFRLGQPFKSMMSESRPYGTCLTEADRYRLTFDGIGTLNIFQTMHGARNVIVKDGIAADWRALASDLRKAMRTERGLTAMGVSALRLED